MNRIKLAAAVLAAALALPALRAGDSPWGIAAHPHSEMEWKNIDRQLGMMREAGMTSLRHDMKFSGIARKKGEYDFRRYDELLARLDEYGMHFLPILEGYDWEIEKSRPDAVPLYKHPEEWRKFVRACAEHYKGRLKVWEIWNEQDGGFWKPNPNASQYVPLLKIAYEELKAADPENIVVVGGLCGWNTGYLRDMYAAGAKGFFDLIAVHPYGYGPDRSSFQQKRMAEFKQIMADNGDAAKPLWITECGGATHRSSLIAQQPDVFRKAIGYAAGKIGRALRKTSSSAPRCRRSSRTAISATPAPGCRERSLCRSLRTNSPKPTRRNCRFSSAANIRPSKKPTKSRCSNM